MPPRCHVSPYAAIFAATAASFIAGCFQPSHKSFMTRGVQELFKLCTSGISGDVPLQIHVDWDSQLTYLSMLSFIFYGPLVNTQAHFWEREIT